MGNSRYVETPPKCSPGNGNALPSFSVSRNTGLPNDITGNEIGLASLFASKNIGSISDITGNSKRNDISLAPLLASKNSGLIGDMPGNSKRKEIGVAPLFVSKNSGLIGGMPGNSKGKDISVAPMFASKNSSLIGGNSFANKKSGLIGGMPGNSISFTSGGMDPSAVRKNKGLMGDSVGNSISFQNVGKTWNNESLLGDGATKGNGLNENPNIISWNTLMPSYPVEDISVNSERKKDGNVIIISGGGSTTYRGVSRITEGQYKAFLLFDELPGLPPIEVIIGVFNNKEEAAWNYDEFAIKYLGEDTPLNFPASCCLKCVKAKDKKKVQPPFKRDTVEKSLRPKKSIEKSRTGKGKSRIAPILPTMMPQGQDPIDPFESGNEQEESSQVDYYTIFQEFESLIIKPHLQNNGGEFRTGNEQGRSSSTFVQDLQSLDAPTFGSRVGQGQSSQPNFNASVIEDNMPEGSEDLDDWFNYFAEVDKYWIKNQLYD